MNRLIARLRRLSHTAWLVTRAGTLSLATHWALAGFSLVSAFGVWFVIQDVENPRVVGDAPALDPAGITVEARDVNDSAIANALPSVTIRVEAREADIPNLRASDFEAFVSFRGVEPGRPETRSVTVESRRSGVTVVSVNPRQIEVSVEPAATKELPVQVRITGAPPVGYETTEAPRIDPEFVTVRGRADQVETVEIVTLEVDLSNERDSTVTIEGDLVAKNSGGNAVDVEIEEPRARATFKITQLISSRQIPISAQPNGHPAPGFAVTNVVVDPPTVLVTGPKAVVDSLQTLSVERPDITNARADVVGSKTIERPPQVIIDRPSVIVRVEIRPETVQKTMVVGVAAFDPAAPPGFVVDSGVYSVTVRLSGTVAALDAVKVADVRATVSLSGAAAGTANYPASVVIDPKVASGVRVDGVDPVAVTLRLVSLP